MHEIEAEELITERLVLVPHLPSLVTPEQVAWLNDKEIVKYSEQRHHEHCLHTQKEYVRWKTWDGPLWLIKLDGQDIGTIAAKLDTTNNRAEMGILIGRKDLYGKGYATEAWRAVMQWLFDKGIGKIECGCMSPNLGMRQVAIKSGMVIEGGRKDHFLLDGKPVDVVYYGKVRE
jgi:RimJ/RimL family protein N-acetyltransferase